MPPGNRVPAEPRHKKPGCVGQQPGLTLAFSASEIERRAIFGDFNPMASQLGTSPSSYRRTFNRQTRLHPQ